MEHPCLFVFDSGGGVRFANAFSLLCALSDIPCVEKIWDAETEGESGHTWNAFFADGIWYNADCALEVEFADEQKNLGVDFLFGFSDEREDNASLYTDRLPVCITEIYPVNVTVISPEDPAFLSQIGMAFDAADLDWILIRLEEGEFTEEDFQKIANYLCSDLYSMPEVWNGKNHYYLFLKD